MRVPKVLTGLGIALTLEVEFKDGVIMAYEFPYQKRYQLAANSTGTALFIFPAKASRSKGKNGEVNRQINKAAKLYEKWSDFEMDSAKAHNVSYKPLKNIGLAYSITYKSDKWSGSKTNYIHQFGNNVTVKMDDEKKPSMIQIYGGRMKVKPEGIVG